MNEQMTGLVISIVRYKGCIVGNLEFQTDVIKFVHDNTVDALIDVNCIKRFEFLTFALHACFNIYLSNNHMIQFEGFHISHMNFIREYFGTTCSNKEIIEFSSRVCGKKSSPMLLVEPLVIESKDQECMIESKQDIVASHLN